MISDKTHKLFEEIAAMTPEHPLYKLVHGEGRS